MWGLDESFVPLETPDPRQVRWKVAFFWLQTSEGLQILDAKNRPVWMLETFLRVQITQPRKMP